MFGIPKSFYWGYIAIALFMIGDGVEQAYLSKYIVNLGFSNSQASLVFMVYGIAVSLASWLSAVLPEIWGPRRTMVIGAVWWIVFHIGFLTFGLSNENYVLMCILYGIRGVGYPLFLYGFLVWLTYVTEKTRLASAIGMFWSMYSVGIGLIGTYLPNLTIPHIGFIGTLWISIIWITTAGVLSTLLIRERGKTVPKSKATKETSSNAIRNISGVYKNPNIIKIFIVRIINQISMFGLPVILPVLFIDKIHFTSSQWLQIWGAMNIALIVGGTFWGFVANRIGWKRQVMWFGCIGTGLATLFYYY
ncbi:polyol permease family [Paenibacillus sophorae]|uniref:MFS transporter n=1 Tax=Paenibacillus sophorae TaxID=1333845 RepID=A0A1H8VBY1_9BACL